MGNFTNVSLFVTLYVKYVFIFQHDDIKNVPVRTLRWKSLTWTLLLTIIAILLNIAFPALGSNQPLAFKLLTKGQPFNR